MKYVQTTGCDPDHTETSSSHPLVHITLQRHDIRTRTARTCPWLRQSLTRQSFFCFLPAQHY